MPAHVITAAQLEAAVAAIRAGKGRNAVAREVGIGRGSVSKIAEDHGLSHHFDRTATAVATRAKQVDAAELRATLELDLLHDAQRLRGLLWVEQDYAQPAGGGEEGPRIMRWTMDTPAPSDKLKLMQAASIALSSSQKIADARGEAGVDEAKSMLVTLMGALGQVYEQHKTSTTTDPSQETP